MNTRSILFAASALAIGAMSIAGTAVHSKVEAEARDAAVAAKKAAREVSMAQRAIAKRKAGDAVQHAEAAAALDPRNAETRALLGQAYLLAGRFQSGAQAFGDALALDPVNGRAALNLALAQVGSGDWAGARATLNAHAAQIPAADLGLAVALAGDAPKGVEILGAAARAPEADAKTRQNLALSLALAGRWPEAKAVAAVDLPPDQVDKRIMQWLQFSQPHNAFDQVAALLGVQAVEDHGQPVQLALNAAAVPVAAVAQTREPVDTYMPGAEQQGAKPAVAQAAPAPVPAAVQVADAAPQAEPAAEAEAPKPALATMAPAPAPVVATPAPHSRMAPRTATAMRAPAKGRYYVQLGAYANVGVERAAWTRLSRRLPMLAEHAPASTTIRTRAGVFHRLSVGGFARSDATALCGVLRAKGGACFVRAAAGDQIAAWSRRTGVQVASR